MGNSPWEHSSGHLCIGFSSSKPHTSEVQHVFCLSFASHFPAPSSRVISTQKLCHMLGYTGQSICPGVSISMLQTSLLAPTLIQATFFIYFNALRFTFLSLVEGFFLVLFQKSTHTCFHLQRQNASTPFKRQPRRQTGECQCCLQFVRHIHEKQFPVLSHCVLSSCIKTKSEPSEFHHQTTSLLVQMPNKNRPLHFWTCFPQTYPTKGFVSLSAEATFPSKPWTLS